MADPTVHRGAGILFVTPQGKALFLKRGPGGDAPGAWCFPGGTIEDGETPEECAIREAGEELGTFPKGDLRVHCRTILPITTINEGLTGTAAPVEDTVDFTTFIQKVGEEFAPQLNGEHTGWAWAAITEPPAPLHPGAKVALDRFSWDELGVARAMSSGLLTSPQLYGNVHLFDMRITGTGVSYRGAKLGEDGSEIRPAEFVYRRPENYLTPEFLARCNGLQVIMMHPPKSLLNSKEFGARTVGAMMLPYIKGDEVWGIAKIYDDSTVKLLMSKQMSTSPGVMLGGGDTKIKTEDGTDLLIEGKPSLLDHLAICERGVWDKGGDPSGVRTDNHTGEDEMNKEQMEAFKAELMAGIVSTIPGVVEAQIKAAGLVRADAAPIAVDTSKLDKVMASIDASLGLMAEFGKKIEAHAARMDAFEKKEDSDDEIERKDGESDEDYAKRKSDAEEEKKKADAEEEKKKADEEAAIAADKARKDADTENMKKVDAVVAENAELRKQLDIIAKNMPKQLTDTDRHAFASAQARADEVYQGFGKRAPMPLSGEDVLPYRRRLASGLKQHSTAWNDVDVLAIGDEATFKIAEDMIFRDAALASLHPTDLQEDELREIVKQDSVTGQRTVEFRGRHSFVRSLTPTVGRLTGTFGRQNLHS